MIKLVGRVTASAQWRIEGHTISLPYRRDVPETETLSKILAYKQILYSKAYRNGNACLCEMFRFFGGMAFVKIGIVFEDAFLDCYSYFAVRFAAQWADGTRCLHSKVIGHACVFDCMLACQQDPIRYDFRYILDEIPNSAIFCDLTERAFAEYWTPKIEMLMARTESLAAVSKLVGDVRLSRYMMRMPEQTGAYLRNLARAFTLRRELINLSKIYCFLFGDGSRINFPGGDNGLFDMIHSVVDEEAGVQNRRFVAENRVSMDLSLDEWILYAKHGVTLRYMRMDFTEIRQPSMRAEVKSFLKNRFSGAIRTDDRIYSSIIYAVNTLCRNNFAFISSRISMKPT